MFGDTGVRGGFVLTSEADGEAVEIGIAKDIDGRNVKRRLRDFSADTCWKTEGGTVAS
jgi:hypothetical protein